jgi:hypothetical protein
LIILKPEFKQAYEMQPTEILFSISLGGDAAAAAASMALLRAGNLIPASAVKLVQSASF